VNALSADVSKSARPDTFDMLVVHRVFKRELGLLPRLVRAVDAGDRSRAAMIAAHYGIVADLLDHHHKGEDALIWPKLLERASLKADVVHRMEAQHQVLHQLLDDSERLITEWERDPSPVRQASLAETLQQLEAAAVEHLVDEEREMLPLIQRHLSVPEWNALGESGQQGQSKSRLLLILGLMLEDATPQDEAKFLSSLPVYARAVWRTLGVASYRRYVRRVRAGVA